MKNIRVCYTGLYNINMFLRNHQSARFMTTFFNKIRRVELYKAGKNLYYCIVKVMKNDRCNIEYLLVSSNYSELKRTAKLCVQDYEV